MNLMLRNLWQKKRKKNEPQKRGTADPEIKMNTNLKVLNPRRNHCDSCQACCTVIGVEELGKPYQTRCQHQIPGSGCFEGGCAVYPGRPNSCRSFECLWLSGVIGDDSEDRPDKSGVIYCLSLCEGRVALDIYIISGAEKKSFNSELLTKVYKFIEDSGIKIHFARLHSPGFVQAMNVPAQPPYEQNWEDGESVWYFPSKRIPGFLIQVPHELAPEELKQEVKRKGDHLGLVESEGEPEYWAEDLLES
jgi:hypothetical protein